MRVSPALAALALFLSCARTGEGGIQFAAGFPDGDCPGARPVQTRR